MVISISTVFTLFPWDSFALNLPKTPVMFPCRFSDSFSAAVIKTCFSASQAVHCYAVSSSLVSWPCLDESKSSLRLGLCVDCPVSAHASDQDKNSPYVSTHPSAHCGIDFIKEKVLSFCSCSGLMLAVTLYILCMLRWVLKLMSSVSEEPVSIPYRRAHEIFMKSHRRWWISKVMWF